jgi:hypothetical protein
MVGGSCLAWPGEVLQFSRIETPPLARSCSQGMAAERLRPRPSISTWPKAPGFQPNFGRGGQKIGDWNSKKRPAKSRSGDGRSIALRECNAIKNRELRGAGDARQGAVLKQGRCLRGFLKNVLKSAASANSMGRIGKRGCSFRPFRVERLHEAFKSGRVGGNLPDMSA